MRVRPQPDRVELAGPLVVQPGLDQVGGEHATVEQVLLVGLEVLEHLLQRAGNLRNGKRLGAVPPLFCQVGGSTASTAALVDSSRSGQM